MSVAVVQSEMFPDLPSVKMPKRVRNYWEELNELADLVDKHGPLIPLAMAGDLLDISRQRVWQLAQEGMLQTVDFRGKAWVGSNTIREFVEMERKAGRPCKELGVVAAAKNTAKRVRSMASK